MDELNDQEDVVDEDIVEEHDEEGNDKTDWKSIALRNQGIAKRLKSKIEKQKEAKEEKPVEKALKETGLDRIDKAILRVEKITAPDEVSLVETFMKESGKDVEGVIGSKFFQAELAALRDAKVTKEATPAGSKRTGQTPKDDVEYWIAKGELPPSDQPDLRRRVVARKREVAADRNQFSDTPVIG
jgi:hypothetical protein